MGREQTDFVNFFYRSLIVRIKDSDLVEFVIKKIQTIRLGRALVIVREIGRASCRERV